MLHAEIQIRVPQSAWGAFLTPGHQVLKAVLDRGQSLMKGQESGVVTLIMAEGQPVMLAAHEVDTSVLPSQTDMSLKPTRLFFSPGDTAFNNAQMAGAEHVPAALLQGGKGEKLLFQLFPQDTGHSNFKVPKQQA